MADEWWANDPIVPAPSKEPEGSKWWEADPVVEPTRSAALPLAVGPGGITRALGTVAGRLGRAAYEGVKGIDKYAAEIARGERDPFEEGPKLALGLIQPSAGVARAATASQLIPRAAETVKDAATAERLAGQPLVGAPIRRATERAVDEYAARLGTLGERAAQGQPAAAGATVRAPFRAAEELDLGLGQLGIAGQHLPAELRVIAQRSPEKVIPYLLDLAGTGGRANPQILGQVKGAVGPKAWSQIENTVIQTLGRTPTGFDAGTAIGNFSTLSEAGKNLLVSPATRRYFDSMAADAVKLNRLANVPAGPTSAGSLRLGMTALGMSNPVTALPALGIILGNRMKASWLAEPATAASLSAWSTAYTKLMIDGGPKSIAGFVIATRNLSNTTGEDIDPQEAIAALGRMVKNPSGPGSSFVPAQGPRTPVDPLRAMGGEPGRGSVMGADPRTPPAPPSGATQPPLGERIDEFIRGKVNPQREAPPEPEPSRVGLPPGWHQPPGRMGQHWVRTPEGQWIRHNEVAFQKGIRETPWFKEFVERHGEEPNLNDPDYDYRRAWAVGARPNVRDPGDGQYHWPSQFKGPNHPNRFVNGIDTRARPVRGVVDNAEPFVDMGIATVRQGKSPNLEGRRSTNVEDRREKPYTGPTNPITRWLYDAGYLLEGYLPAPEPLATEAGLADLISKRPDRARGEAIGDRIKRELEEFERERRRR